MSKGLGLAPGAGGALVRGWLLWQGGGQARYRISGGQGSWQGKTGCSWMRGERGVEAITTKANQEGLSEVAEERGTLRTPQTGRRAGPAAGEDRPEMSDAAKRGPQRVVRTGAQVGLGPRGSEPLPTSLSQLPGPAGHVGPSFCRGRPCQGPDAGPAVRGSRAGGAFEGRGARAGCRLAHTGTWMHTCPHSPITNTHTRLAPGVMALGLEPTQRGPGPQRPHRHA